MGKSSEKEKQKIPEEFSDFIEDELTERQALKNAYDNICKILDFYMDLPSDVKNVVALWIIGTYYNEEYNSFPYLFINAMRGSGKTRLLKIITSLSKDGLYTTSLTDSVLFRTKGMLGLDEFENVGSKDKTSLRELLNASYKKGVKVLRMKKKKNLGGEEMVVEEFNLYRPVAMANIWGMEEVLGDRCIKVLLERSSDTSRTQLIEDFENLEIQLYTKNLLNYSYWCRVCRCIVAENIHKNWNVYVKNRHNTTHYEHNTYTTLLYTHYTREGEEQQKQEEEVDENQLKMFGKIYDSALDGRNLELFVPLLFLSHEISEEVFDDTLEYAKKFVKEKRVEEIIESRDVSVYSLVAKEPPRTWRRVKDLVDVLRLSMGGEGMDWINTQWLGKSLKRLNLILDRKRMGKGVQVILDVNKAKEKERLFRPVEEDEKSKLKQEVKNE